MEHRCVLVQVGSNKHTVEFLSEESGGELLQLKKAVLETFKDVLNTINQMICWCKFRVGWRVC